VITTPAAWNTANAQLGKMPIYVFVISGESIVYSTHDLAACGITGTLPACRAWLKTPRGSSQSIDVVNGTSSIGELEVEIVDQAGALRQLVGGTNMEGRTATLYIGYPGIAYTEFVLLQTYVLYKITPGKSYGTWIFRSRDRQLSAKRTIYDNPYNGQPLSETNPWILQGTPAEICQAVWLFGLGRSDSELDRSTLLVLDSASEGLYHAVRPFRFHLIESFEAKQFLESEIFKPSGLYPVVTNSGKMSLRAFRSPASGPATVFTFTEDNTVILPEVDRMQVVNEIIFKFDQDANEAKTEVVYIDATSVGTYGRASQLLIESKGLRTELGAQWFCQEVSNRLFRRFAGTPTGLRGGAPVLRVDAFLLTLPVWVGDFVAVTHSMMPNLTTGELGVTNRVFEVIDREPDFSNGRMKYQLLDTGLTGLAPAHKWASSDRDFIIGSSEVY
jgi:hypothetical protein